MKFLTVDKVHKIIELADLIGASKDSNSTPEAGLSEVQIFQEVLAEYLDEYQNTNAPIHP